jgi:ribosomal protein L7/L12
MEYLVALSAALLAVLLLGPALAGIRASQRRIERKVDFLLTAQGLALVAPVSAEVVRLATTFQMAQAIKLHRAETGADLSEAKAAIDAAVAKLRAG